MDQSDIKIDKEGLWHYRGAHMFRKDILCVFFEHLKQDDCGRYFVEINREICYLDVEDTAFVVTAVYKTKDACGSEALEIMLNDDQKEELDAGTLAVGKDNVLYCRVKNDRFPARFTRKGYYQLAEFIEPGDADNEFFLVLNRRRYPIECASLKP
ncbi:MAG: DUF1285 domain-containing protein [Smithellaceae bacterium]|jgi:hypothetical protein|nr:DUF1285 domain-containing protein [Smithellaceae bacterium]